MFASLLIQTTFVLTIAAAASLALRRASSAARHAIWTGALVCVLLLPVLRWSAPSWRVEAPRLAAPVAAVVAYSDPTPLQTPVPAPARRFDLRLLWLAGASIAAARLLAGFARLRTLKMRASPWLGLRAGVPGRVSLLASDRVQAPITFGILRSTILLPTGAEQWPAERLRLVLAHELAHVRRRDCAVQLLVELARALYWFQPLVWLAASQVHKERERACDDAVLRAGTKSTDYAEHLLGVVRSVRLKGAPIAMAISINSHDLQARLEAVLKPHIDRRAASGRLIAAIAALALCIAVPLAIVRAQPAGSTGALAGSVYDASRAAIPNAAITATGLDTHNKEAARSGADGSYQFRNLPAGRYLLEVRAPGFALYRQQVAVAAGQAVQFDPMLDLGNVSETIDVVGQKPANTGAAPQAVPHRIRVGGNVQATKLLYRVPPVYPQHAKDAGIQGAVVLQGVIRTDGSLLSLEVLSKSVDPELAQAARDAVSQWRYQPTLLNGQPVEVVTTITVNFRLE